MSRLPLTYFSGMSASSAYQSNDFPDEPPPAYDSSYRNTTNPFRNEFTTYQSEFTPDDFAAYQDGFDYEIEGPPFTCGICMDDKPRSDSYVFDCESSHTFCRDCSREVVRGDIEGNKVPRCPGERCKHELSEQEMKQLLPEQLEKYSTMLLNRLVSQGPFLVCKCKHVMAAHSAGEQERVECPKCRYTFCSLCNEDYHYRCTCQELKQYRNIWTAWLRKGRNDYQSTVAQQERRQKQQYEKQTKEFVAAQKKHEEDRAAALRAFETLQQDEQYKARSARMCPHCGRVVEKITGCDTMTCGQDAHGGNVQSGCGRGFTWTSAPMYRAAAVNTPTIEAFVAQAPQQAGTQGFRHEYARCDNCGSEEIVGLKFECLNCPAYDLCGKCERNGTRHDQRHVFRIWKNDRDNGLQ
ncbi:uncharacterized protein BDZ99DRAFT_459524 [Mytilinidion resinicola]|uniref:RBR-type E3 ubiquitin transferase n=1 Tax=Mytilinidion resinicola TaxID=574789 RepID=A0A6A6YZ41_9PEZI|nr:uncharacterized protein BDZ99DRAFT_459524 [Mytilinidion resinicola]KAF2813769.1 hypothetical protein BDZ99DRAFT_459524 [Mytilinidion resinicola]